MIYLDPSDENVAALLARRLQGNVVMLNLLKLRETADYSDHPQLAPAAPISGRQAFEKYVEHTLPFLARSGGELLYLGTGGTYFIGPADEGWDLVMLVRQQSLESFFSFATDAAYLAGIGHRAAAVLYSRLRPLTDETGRWR